MMQKFWLFLIQRRTLIVIGWLAFAALLFLLAALLQLPPAFPWIVLAVALAFGARTRRRQAGRHAGAAGH